MDKLNWHMDVSITGLSQEGADRITSAIIAIAEEEGAEVGGGLIVEEEGSDGENGVSA